MSDVCTSVQSDLSEVPRLSFFKPIAGMSDEVQCELDECKTDLGSVPEYGNYFQHVFYNIEIFFIIAHRCLDSFLSNLVQ